MITAETPMSDVVAAMAAGNAEACTEFVRRQGRENLPVLSNTLSSLWRGVWNAQWADIEAMRRWKYPEHLPALDPATLRALMEAAERDDDDGMALALAGLSLAHIAQAAGIHARLKMALTIERERPSPAAARGLAFEGSV